MVLRAITLAILRERTYLPPTAGRGIPGARRGGGELGLVALLDFPRIHRSERAERVLKLAGYCAGQVLLAGVEAESERCLIQVVNLSGCCRKTAFLSSNFFLVLNTSFI